jgi:hypothetical protein
MLSPALRAVLLRLPPHDAAALAPGLAPSARRYLRDAMIRVALARDGNGQLHTHAVCTLSQDLRRHLEPGTFRTDLIDAILALNDNRPIGARQLWNIGAGLTAHAMTVQELATKLHNP